MIGRGRRGCWMYVCMFPRLCAESWHWHAQVSVVGTYYSSSHEKTYNKQTNKQTQNLVVLNMVNPMNEFQELLSKVFCIFLRNIYDCQLMIVWASLWRTSGEETQTCWIHPGLKCNMRLRLIWITDSWRRDCVISDGLMPPPLLNISDKGGVEKRPCSLIRRETRSESDFYSWCFWYLQTTPQ